MNGTTFTRSYGYELMGKISGIICYGNECFLVTSIVQSSINLRNIFYWSRRDHFPHLTVNMRDFESAEWAKKSFIEQNLFR